MPSRNNTSDPGDDAKPGDADADAEPMTATSPPTSDNNHRDVVVVGAGISGLAATRGLVEAGKSVAAIEHRDRVGGRLWSPELNDQSGRVDLGATWFWPGEPRVLALAEEFGLPLHQQHLDGDATYHQPNVSQRIDGNPIDVPSYRFSNGAQSLAEAVAGVIPEGVIQLNTTVTSVRGVGPFELDVVEQANGSRTVITADHIVLALPPALAASNIAFAPPLPDRLHGLASMTPVWMGSTTKVVVHFARAFWRDAGLSGSAISHIGPMREIHDMSGPGGNPAALFGFVPNMTPGPEPTADEIRHQLVELFGADAANPSQILIADWRKEPGTAPDGVEALRAYQAFGHDLYQRPSLDGRLHWCSTETAVISPGHIEGALASAERVVSQIASSNISPSSLQGSHP